MLTREEAKTLAGKALSFSTFPECEVNLESSESAFIRFALNGVTTSGFVVERSLSISSTRDGKTGSTQVDEFDDKSLREAVRRTEELALIAPPNPEHVAPLAPQKYRTEENFAAGTSTARNKEMIPHVRAIIDAAKEKDLVAAGYFERVATTSAIGPKAAPLAACPFFSKSTMSCSVQPCKPPWARLLRSGAYQSCTGIRPPDNGNAWVPPNALRAAWHSLQ